MTTQSTFEITTIMPEDGCPIKCYKYCPQELIAKSYKGERILSLSLFEKALETVPKETGITFAGFSEPFLNQDCADMIIYAYEKGHAVRIASTCVGLKMEDAKRIEKIPFTSWIFHLPDAYGNSKIPDDPVLEHVAFYLFRHIKKSIFMNMGGLYFVDNRVQKLARGQEESYIKGDVMCDLLKAPNYQILPNGDVFFCCMTRGLKEKVGSIHEKTYLELLNRYPVISARLKKDPKSICHQCSCARKWWVYSLIELKDKVFGAVPIMERIQRL